MLEGQHLRIEKFGSQFLMTAEADTSLSEVLIMMIETNIRHIPVVSEGKPIGIIAERDIRLIQEKGMADKYQAIDLMIQHPYSVPEGSDLREVIKTMYQHKYGSCLIEDDKGNLVGIFTMIDALRTLDILLEGNDQSTIERQKDA